MLSSKSAGVTSSERYLHRLSERCFLSMWSYPGVYRDQGQELGGIGKEVCDLLVVFENSIIIFSDKDCAFPDTGNIELDWSRWFRKAVFKSAQQIWGAERWIFQFPDRMFLDRECTSRFPIDLPAVQKARVHRVVVAHSVSARCKQELGGSGSLMIDPDIVGGMHMASRTQGGVPFAVGHIDPGHGYVHVLDDTGLDIVLQTLDTITDFLRYLEKKEAFIESGRLGMAAGEEDLLAYYLAHVDGTKRHDFLFDDEFTHVFIDEGHWEDFARNPQRLAQIEADQISYAWDSLIETFLHHVYQGTSHYISHPELTDQERLFRLLAREPRTRRRMLARGLLELIGKTPENIRATRTILPSYPGDPYYIFLVLPDLDHKQSEAYRTFRRELLTQYCLITKVQHPEANDIIGIATESGHRVPGSEDIIYLDAREWTDEQQHDAEANLIALRDVGLFGDQSWHRFVESEYPEPEVTQSHSTEARARIRKGGRYRNLTCPCGSGRKYKHCCGR